MVYITGYGLLSSLPEDPQNLWNTLNATGQALHSVVDVKKFAPFFTHPLTDYCVETQIPNQTDRRVMSESMQAAVYAAGLALNRANLTPDERKDTDIIVSFSGGERDETIDNEMLCQYNTENIHTPNLNELLMTHVRPTLFLKQLPNLLTANIAILHGTTGNSLTLMGEETAGAQAIQIAYQRILSGKTERVLVGSVSIGETRDKVLRYATENLLLSGKFLPVWDRNQGGICLGSASGFLLLESSASAKKRQVPGLARFSYLNLTNTLQENWQPVFAQNHHEWAILSGLNAYPGHVQQEIAFWTTHAKQEKVWIRALSSVMGTLLSATFPSYLILALICLQRQQLFAPLPSQLGIEQAYPCDRTLDKLWVHSQGHLSGHALACLERI